MELIKDDSVCNRVVYIISQSLKRQNERVIKRQMATLTGKSMQILLSYIKNAADYVAVQDVCKSVCVCACVCEGCLCVSSHFFVIESHSLVMREGQCCHRNQISLIYPDVILRFTPCG